MTDEKRKIRILPPEEARRIAAGEVIDRPSALVREFLDNAIDANARAIEVFIDEGGISRTELVDDGDGMDREDLELCPLTHATSKIRSLDDLLSARTLGFRGEALAAAAAVSRLEILSSRDGKEAWKMSAGPGGGSGPLLEPGLRTRGTSVRAFGLYDTIPARKRFLKRPGSEGTSCRQIFNEKAMAFPGIAFRFVQDGVLKAFFPPVPTLRERFIQIHLDEKEGTFLHEIAANGNGFAVAIVAGGPELPRRDRRLQFVFANSRRIQDYSLLQALEYGLEGWFPNGTHPLGAVFVNIDPALADFNIHPAKREARFADSGAIHHAVSAALRDFSRSRIMSTRFDNAGSSSSSPGAPREASVAGSEAPQLAMEALLSNPPDFTALPGRGALAGPAKFESAAIMEGVAAEASAAAEKLPPYGVDGSIRFIGRLFGLFILVEKGDSLFIIDQHAAHERILYERILGGPVPRQELLVAIPFNTGSAEDDRFIENQSGELEKLGIAIRQNEGGWLIEALPSAWKLPDRETVEEILNLRNSGGSMAERWAASLACHAAIKEGDFLDERAALALAEEAFALQISRCPHGRPIWHRISLEELLRAVKRN